VNLSSEVKIYSIGAVKGMLTVEITNANGDNNGDVNLTVYDICGKTLLKQSSSAARQQLDLSSYPKGIYLIFVSTKQYSKTLQYILD